MKSERKEVEMAGHESLVLGRREAEVEDTRKPADHQRRTLRRLRTWWKSNSKSKANGYLSMPTGSGKTLAAARFLTDEIITQVRQPRILWVAHNEFLLQQAEAEFHTQLASANLDDDVSIARFRGDGTGAQANIRLATIQTLANPAARKRLTDAGDPHLVVFDEFHHLAAPAWRSVPIAFRKRGVRLLGLSATPFRRSRSGTVSLRRLLPERVYSVGLRELIRTKFLADPIIRRIQTPGTIDMDTKEMHLLRQFGHLPQSVLDKVAKQGGRDQLIVDTFVQDSAEYGSTIAFCCSVAHANALAVHLQKQGISARSICGSSKSPVNQAALEDFRAGRFQVATSVVLLTEGVDVPACRTVMFCRPTESPILVSQMMGRAMRGREAGGHDTCYLIDFCDIFEQAFDLSGSHFAFVRDYDEKLRRLVRRRTEPDDHGVSAALLLRIWELLNQRAIEGGDGIDAAAAVEEEVTGWVDYWDGEMQRVLLIRHDEQDAVVDALEEVAESDVDDDDIDDLARGVYDDRELDAVGVSEEDFVGIASAVKKDRGRVQTHALLGPGSISTDRNATKGALAAIERVENEFEEAGALVEHMDALAALRRLIDSQRNGSRRG
jgi:superfamily II DNA or RNA helicase